MEKKKTAVEWLKEQIQERVIAYDETGRKMIILIYMVDYQQLSEEAKVMEKEQLQAAFKAGWMRANALNYDPSYFEHFLSETYDNH